jgi:autotransporter adhesin
LNSTAIGERARASGAESTALGQSSTAGGSNSTAVGQGSNASGNSSVALGENARAVATNSTALGQSATASGVSATAVGQGSTAGFTNSAAIGAGVTATADNQFAIGNANNTYTMAGSPSDASRDAQVGPVEVVTTDAFGNLASDNGRIFRELDDLEEGVAMAMALPSLGVLPHGTPFAISGAWGTFGGANALAAAGSFAITPNLMIEGGVAFGLDHNNVGARAGVIWAFGGPTPAAPMYTK